MSTALITGASGGIGLELAKIFAKEKIDLVLVARSEDKLLKIKNDFETLSGIKVTVIAKDLSLPDAPKEIYDNLKEMELSIDILINNAGFGYWGSFTETKIEKELQMLNLNINALTYLTKLFAKDMVNQGNGKIMNVASVAAFMPGPFMAVYYATKSYVLSFSQALAEELTNKGVTVTTLCPGPTKTGFENTAELNESKLFKTFKPVPSYKVAEFGFKALMKGKRVAVYGLSNKIMIFFLRFAPNILILKMVKSIQGK
jgi:short-subunit dehydrogenase